MSSLNESMYTQYLAWYQRHLAKYGPNTAVLMQVGKFFEIYDRLNLETNTTQTNIREIADLCSLNLSESTDPENGQQLKLFGGFPEMSLPKFEKQLLDAGFTVVVVVQKKNAKGDVEERIVDHISSPGIYESRYSAGRLEDTNDSCLLGLLIDTNDANSKYVGLAAIDVQTGNTWSTETVMPFIQQTPNIDAIEPFFMMHPPAEVVCWSSDTITEAQIRSWFRFPQSIKLHMRKDRPSKINCEFLREAYSMKTALSPSCFLGLERYPQAFNCLYGTLTFVEEHIPSLLKRLRNNSVWVPESRVRLGNAALEQLAIVSNNSECLLHWLQKTFTAIGRRALRERVLTPISDITELQTRFRRIDYLRTQTEDSAIEKQLRTIYDLSRLHRKLHLHSISTLDVYHLLVTYNSISELIRRFSGTESAISEANKVLNWLKNDSWSLDRLRNSEKITLDRTHPWLPGIHPELDAFENRWVDLLNLIRKYTDKFQEAQINIIVGEHSPFEFMTTKKRFEKIEQPASDKLSFHPTSAKSSGGSLDSRSIQEFQKTGARILREWSHLQDTIWSDTISKWSTFCDSPIGETTMSEFITKWVANLDAEFSLARCAKLYDLITPEFISSENSNLAVQGLRHPIIERITASNYVKHSISLGFKNAVDEKNNSPDAGSAENGLLIYGTNASGKSSLMKALGIAVLCAQTGIPVAASSFKLAPYNSIFTRILSNDNLWSSLSSFAVEMTEFRAILKYADANSLVLGDELCSGTETRSATAIVSAGIQTLVKRGTQFLFATHLHEISEIEEIRNLGQVKFAHLGVEYNPISKQIIYNRNLEPGPGKSLYGLEVCYGLDMDPEFLELANQCRNRETRNSRYNSAVSVRRCEVCKSSKDLESHHIKHQATAKNGFVMDGQRTHDANNLTVLCEHCHKAHHTGKLEILGWIDTSEGRTLSWRFVERIVSDKIHEKPAEDNYNLVKERLLVLLSKGKKEKELIQILENEFTIQIKTKMYRAWKKQLGL